MNGARKWKTDSDLAWAAEAAAAAAPFSGILAEWAFNAAWMANFFFSRSASHSLWALFRSSSWKPMKIRQGVLTNAHK